MKLYSKRFWDLKKKWDKKLKDAGFEDQEDAYGNLKSTRKYTLEEYIPKERYYQLAGQLLHSFPFTSKESRMIWRRHALGWTNQEIAEDMGIDVRVVAKSIATTASHIVDV